MAGTDCTRNPSTTLVFACSGAADVGAIADQTARTLAREGMGKMFCTVGLGGKVKPVLETTQAASRILAIDGCFLDCAKHCLAQAGFDTFAHLRLTDLGMSKGHTEVSHENVSKVVEEARKLLC